MSWRAIITGDIDPVSMPGKGGPPTWLSTKPRMLYNIQDESHSGWHRCAQRCNSENKHSVVTAMVLIVILERWQWQHWDSSGSAGTEITMCTLVRHCSDSTVSCNYTFLAICISLSYQCEHRCHSAVICHHYHTSVLSSVTASSLSSLLQRCQFTSLIYCCCHRCHSTVRYTAVTVLSLPPISH